MDNLSGLHEQLIKSRCNRHIFYELMTLTLLSILKRKLTTLLKMAQGDRRLFVEAVYYLAVARFYVRFIPLSCYAGSLGPAEPSSRQSIDESTQISRRIGKEIMRAANNVPWDTVCLPQAIAAKWMLRKRHIPSVLFLGVAASDEHLSKNELARKTFTNKMYLSAHAWLKVGDIVVTGRLGHKKFTVLKSFYWLLRVIVLITYYFRSHG